MVRCATKYLRNALALILVKHNLKESLLEKISHREVHLSSTKVFVIGIWIASTSSFDAA